MKKTEYLYIKEYINFIRKALECCSKSKTNGDCMALNCPCFKYGMCIFVDDDLGLQNLALDLINRQKAEIKKLKSENEILSRNADNAFQEGLNERRELFEPEIKVEAYKEFAERLRKTAVTVTLGNKLCRVVTIVGIDKRLKEMMGEKE